MRKFIFAIVVLTSVISFANAGEMQEVWCGDKSFYDCINHFEKQCESKNYAAVGLWEICTMGKSNIIKLKNTMKWYAIKLIANLHFR